MQDVGCADYCYYRFHYGHYFQYHGVDNDRRFRDYHFAILGHAPSGLFFHYRRYSALFFFFQHYRRPADGFSLAVALALAFAWPLSLPQPIAIAIAFP